MQCSGRQGRSGAGPWAQMWAHLVLVWPSERCLGGLLAAGKDSADVIEGCACIGCDRAVGLGYA
jgi:hypothetical protein